MSDSIRTINGKKIIGLLTNKFHVTKTQEKTFTVNDEYTPDEGYDAFSKVIVDLPMEEKTIKTNGAYTPTSPNVGFSKVIVDLPMEEKTIKTNGEYEPTSPNVGFSKVIVDLPMEEKTVTANGEYEPTSPNVGFSKVKVAVPITLAKLIYVDFPGLTKAEIKVESSDQTTQGGLVTTIYSCNAVSTSNTYSGYKFGNDKFTTSCEINGITVTADNTAIDTSIVPVDIMSGIIATVTRYAKFVNGVLTLWTTYVIEPTSTIFMFKDASVDPLSTSATMTIT